MATNDTTLIVVHRCGHVRSYLPHPDSDDSSRARIAASESQRNCLECNIAAETKRRKHDKP